MKAPRIRSQIAFAASLALVVACSGAGNEDLFASEGTSSFTDRTEPGNGAGALPTPPASSSGGSSGAQSSGSSSSGGSSSGGSSSGSSSGGSSSGGSSSGSSSGGSSSSGSSSGGSSSGGSSSGGVVTPDINCGKENNGTPRVCSGGSSCCAKRSGNGSLQLSCVAPVGGQVGQCTGAVIRCDSAADCPSGNVCCGSFEQTFGYKSVQCQPQCVTQLPGVTMVRMCDPNAAVDECASMGLQCEPSGSLPGFHVCK